MGKYKVFYLQEQVAEFNIMYNAIVYIYQQIENDKSLEKEDFFIYELKVEELKERIGWTSDVD